ncbi:hypothetical protein A3A46_00585 [Candidatus Roizmanbacteria bacterium RIFCSPLOWO2_01_FULL_37_13]|uniref:Uncharacterized protein n=1 Tax=Candidatus Roizmanbacteria bacterium RIFCSPHIGHO2_02_FULL_38_11 TaxID=1802039 RepID=A0A1F7H1N4_9BACT|nr:MAG: hypothetical protein A3C25_02445 [Candidatus Roizmanbacteria bacterium RIFCSPHIGHO2_02_FULL_38_11]OGK34277.1 MAG: hypothetical protein A3F58_00905 [Candidatus Roizmanbacteria bacterium RIFCSPHIGHO2_12_FULL_37_9b]OGK43234.1 MAG: hypothetical protein A3A46_00585 [Candidatus Roizmanbacteria bacterium RIFCSPLOWO2_01_FULL_37_13]
MKKLEKKILKKVYSFETRQTLSELALRLLAMMSLILGSILLCVFIVRELIQQQTLDVFEIFFEDLGVVSENIGEVTATFLQELPKVEMFLAIVAIVLSFLLVVKFMQNFVKVKNKINSIVKFWFVH